MMGPGTPGSELVQLLSSAYVDLEDYARLDEVISDFHAKLVAASPEWVKTEYSEAMLVDDFRTSLILFFCGACGTFTPIVKALLPEAGTKKEDLHPLWPLIAVWFPRVVQCLKQMKVAARMAELLAAAEEGVPPV